MLTDLLLLACLAVVYDAIVTILDAMLEEREGE